MLLSFAEIAGHRRDATMEGVKHRFEHIKIAPGGRRLFFLHRWPRPGGGRPFFDRLFTVSAVVGDRHAVAG